MLRVFGIRRCDTMSRAMAWLNEHQIEFHLHDYKKDGVPADRLFTLPKDDSDADGFRAAMLKLGLP